MNDPQHQQLQAVMAPASAIFCPSPQDPDEPLLVHLPLRQQTGQRPARAGVGHHNVCGQLGDKMVSRCGNLAGQPGGRGSNAHYSQVALRQGFSPFGRQLGTLNWPGQYNHHRAARLQQHGQHRLLQRRVEAANHHAFCPCLLQSPVHGGADGRAGAPAGGKKGCQRFIQQATRTPASH